MERIRAYLLSVTAAALICGMVLRLLSQKGTASSIGKMVCGIFLALVIIGPVAKLSMGELLDFSNQFELDASEAVADGAEITKNTLSEIIKSRTEAYILDKAGQYGAELSVRVELSGDSIPVPVSVRLSGAVSPYAKGRLQEMLQEDLGIAKEKQIWT